MHFLLFRPFHHKFHVHMKQNKNNISISNSKTRTKAIPWQCSRFPTMTMHFRDRLSSGFHRNRQIILISQRVSKGRNGVLNNVFNGIGHRYYIYDLFTCARELPWSFSRRRSLIHCARTVNYISLSQLRNFLLLDKNFKTSTAPIIAYSWILPALMANTF